VRACIEHGSKTADGAGFVYRLADTEVKTNAAGAVQVIFIFLRCFLLVFLL
jgi:hypothetical protein